MAVPIGKGGGAIMTTDTFPKLASASAKFGNQTITLTGIAKGSGMIAPDMATMLAFVFHRCGFAGRGFAENIERGQCRQFYSRHGRWRYVDLGYMFAGCHGCQADQRRGDKSADDKRLAAFKRRCRGSCKVAQQVARDGEGITKLMTIEVSGAENNAAARQIALAIGNSPLVKTAIAGGDANWGRIVMAVGKSGEKAERDKLAISIGGVKVARQGKVVPGYREAPVARHMKGKEISIAVNVGVKSGRRGQRVFGPAI